MSTTEPNDLDQTFDAIDIVDKNELEAMSPEERAEFENQIDQSKHAYINNAFAQIFKDVHVTAEFAETIQGLVENHIVDLNGVRHIPKLQDVLYNLTVYSACALERLSYGKPYRTNWVDPLGFAPAIGASYLVMLSCGLILEAKMDSMEVDNFQLLLADSTTRINKNRLLAINTYVTDAEDYMRGAPRISYDALSRIEATVVPAPKDKIEVKRSPAVVARMSNNQRNRDKRARKSK